MVDQAIDLLEEEFTRWVRVKKPTPGSLTAPDQAISEQEGIKEEESASQSVPEPSAAGEPESTAHEVNPDMAAKSIEANGYTAHTQVSTYRSRCAKRVLLDSMSSLTQFGSDALSN